MRNGWPTFAGSRGPCDFHGLEMIIEDIRQLRDRHATKAAIGAQSEIGQIFPRGLQTRFERGHAVDHSQVNASATRPKVFERLEECLVGTVKDRNVDPIYLAPRSFHEAVGEVYSLTEIIRLESGPSA